jgi:type IV pilus assembly protein PilE
MRALRTGKGFTLIELMIAVAIVAVLVTIAYPGYQEQVRKSRRAEAQGALLELSNFMERFFTENNRYDQNRSGNAVALPFTESPKDGTTKYYDLSFQAGTLGQTQYTLQAVPKGAQSNDRCGTLRLTHTGARSVTTAATDCWK